ncbi:MAG TPA: PAS domain S-box protein, partial [Anaeromyxobacteraceae bacterium]
MVLLTDAEHRLLDANDRAAALLLYSRDELLRMTLPEIRDPSTVADFPERVRQERAHGGALFETRYRRKDGSTFPVEVSVRVFELNGQLYHQGTARDITERKRTEADRAAQLAELRQAQEALRASEAKFRAAFHGAGMGIHFVDAAGRIVEHNHVLSDMLGYSPEEMRGRTLRDLLDPGHVAPAQAALREMVEGRRERVVEERRYRKKDGAFAHAVVRATAVRDEHGAFQYAVAVVEDVTDKRALEAQLLFADRMSALGTLAAGVAHEINNPLAFVLSNLSYAIEELGRAGARPTEVTRALEEAREGAVRVKEIVRDLKTFSRPEERPDEEVDLPSVLRSAMNLAQNEIRHRAQLQVDLQPVPPVLASAHRLGQVFLNLLINAAQAIPEGQADQNRIRVHCRSAGQGRVAVDISDTGSGIPPEHLARIFEPFFTTKPVGVGTGLGLSVCHGIVTALGGDIAVESRPGATTFRVTLPAVTLAPMASPGGRPAPAGRARILVVDDEPMVARALARILAAHEVTVLDSAPAALERLRQDPAYDVVLCDLMMPEMSGMELHERLREEGAAAASERLVFVTGGAFTAQAREFLARVPNPRVEKPFEPATLRALV